MFEYFFASSNLPFAVALLVMLGIAAIECVILLLGGGLSGALDSASHDLNAEVDAGADAAHAGSALLSWLHVGRVPFLILLVFFLLSFGLTGLTLQYAIAHILGHMLPGWLAAVLVLPITLPGVRVFGRIFARIMPRDETTAVPRSSFVGSIAVITLGTARRGAPAEAKLRDQHGQTHYVMVEPDDEHDAFAAGTSVILLGQNGAFFRAMRSTLSELTD